MRSILILAICAGVACGEKKRSEAVWNIAGFDPETWGAMCGSMDAGRRGRWIVHEWRNYPERLVGPLFTCELTYRPFGRQIVSLYVSGVSVSRAEAEAVVDGLVVRYLRRDLAFIARGVALWGDSTEFRYQTQEVKMVGRWNASSPHGFQLKVAVPYHY